MCQMHSRDAHGHRVHGTITVRRTNAMGGKSKENITSVDGNSAYINIHDHGKETHGTHSKWHQQLIKRIEAVVPGHHHIDGTHEQKLEHYRNLSANHLSWHDRLRIIHHRNHKEVEGKENDKAFEYYAMEVAELYIMHHRIHPEHDKTTMEESINLIINRSTPEKLRERMHLPEWKTLIYREIAKLQQHFKSQESHGLIDLAGAQQHAVRHLIPHGKLHEKKHGDLLTDPEEVRANAARGIIELRKREHRAHNLKTKLKRFLMNNKQHLQALTNAGISAAHVASGGVFLVLHVAINQYLKAVSRNPEMYLSAADLKKLKAFSGYMSALDTSTTKVYVAYREAGILLPEMEYLIKMNKKEFKLEELLERQEKGHAEKLEASDTSHEIKQMEKKLGVMTNHLQEKMIVVCQHSIQSGITVANAIVKEISAYCDQHNAENKSWSAKIKGVLDFVSGKAQETKGGRIAAQALLFVRDPATFLIQNLLRIYERIRQRREVSKEKTPEDIEKAADNMNRLVAYHESRIHTEAPSAPAIYERGSEVFTRRKELIESVRDPALEKGLADVLTELPEIPELVDKFAQLQPLDMHNKLLIISALPR